MKNRNLRTKIKIGAWAAAFALAAAVGFGGCTNASDSSGGVPETTKYSVHFSVTDSAGGTITAALADGTEIGNGDAVEKGKTVTFTAKANDGYTVGEWKIDGGNFEKETGTEGAESAKVIIASDVTVTVTFKSDPPSPPPADTVSYTVKHYKETLEGGYELARADSLHGKAGENAAYTPDTSYTGFTYDANLTEINGTVQPSGTIKADGTSTVKLYYVRNTISVTFTLEGGNINGNTSAVVRKGKYEAAFDKPADPVKKGYTFKGWKPVLPASLIFPSADTTYTAEWEADTYEVVLKVVNGSGDTLSASYNDQNVTISTEKTLSVPYGTIVTFTAKPYAMDSWHVKKRQVKSWSITANDGSSVRFTSGGTKGSTSAQAAIDRPVSVQVEFESDFVPPKEGTIRISIAGDERVDTVASDFVDIAPNTRWHDIKDAVKSALHLKSEWQGGDYGLYEWKLNDKNGGAIDGSRQFTEHTTVYAVTNYTKFNVQAGELKGYTGENPRGHIILPSGITKIGYRAFWNCSDLTGELIVPEGTAVIDAGAFSGCEKLETLVLPSTLVSIGGFAFYECKNLTGELELPENLTSIGKKAFSSCSNLSGELVLPASLTTLDGLAFNDCSKLTSVKILFTDTTEMQAEAFGYFNNMQNITRFTVKTEAVKDTLKSYGISENKIIVDSTI